MSDRNFTKFIILSRARTGSNFLASMLRSHGEVICFGELFHTRRNILRVHLSERIAVKTGRWTILRDDDAHHDVAVELKFAECVKTIEDEREDSERYQRFFADHDVLEVYYEELVSNTDAETDRIQRFLGVPRRQLRAKTRKQARQRSRR